MNESRTFTVSFLKKEQLTEDTYSFYFDRPSDFQFEPGQYLRLTLDIVDPDERGNKRMFTISSSPTEKDHLTITTRIIQSSFKKTLHALTANTPVTIFGPLGRFVLNEQELAPRVFLAGGIGITPFHSMIRYAADKNLSIPITLFTSFKNADEVVFREELKEIIQKHSRFELVETVTRPEEGKKPWDGHVGRVDAEWIKQNVANISSSLFYISGPGKMVDALSEVVQSLDVDQEKIRTEKFPGY